MFFGTFNRVAWLPTCGRPNMFGVADWVRQVTRLAGITESVTPGTTQAGFIREAGSRGFDEYDIAASTNRTSLEHIARHTSDSRKVTAVQRLIAARTHRNQP